MKATKFRMARSVAMAALAASFTIASLSSAEPAAAARIRPPRPTPTPAPIQTVPAPSSLVVAEAEANRMIVSVDPGSGYVVEGEYVSGPLIPGNDIVGSPRVQVFLVDGGNYWVTNLVPDSSYVVRFRRIGFYNSATNVYTTVTSPYTQFTFRTPTLAASRPSAPQIGILSDIAPYLRLSWAPSTDNASTTTQIRYVYNLSSQPLATLTPTCSQYCFGTTGATLIRPPSGTRIVVYAIDSAGISSLPSNEIIVP